MKKLFVFILTTTVFVSCSNSEQETKESTTNSMQNNSSTKGDTSSYERMPEMTSDTIQR